MTTGLKIPSSYYIEIITTFPPRPITCEAELIATQNRIDSILSRKNPYDYNGNHLWWIKKQHELKF